MSPMHTLPPYAELLGVTLDLREGAAPLTVTPMVTGRQRGALVFRWLY